jgi:hypothetical protein
MNRGRDDYIMINLIKSIALLALLEGGELLGAAGSVVKQNVGELIDRHARSVVQDVLGIAGSASTVRVKALAERVN